ncbi:hypothetical protein CK203_026042 [Vitis vinifera]|uniref:Uncharacterized protein n=1 Tax=Vitis vinifera TaxID=29760 RepID=A0A438IJJ6_VITVI|nr:hypothetical protein CK203_026042 [Vitis vinifera]
MDAVLQIFKRSICPGASFFESLAKKPPTTMDDLFRRANKYSMLEDDVRAATQQVLVAGRPSRGLSDFRWPRPQGTDPSTRDHSKRCVFHKEHGHTKETCRSLQYLVEKLIKAGHLKQYLRSDTKGKVTSQHHNPGAPRAPAAPKAIINYSNEGPSDEERDNHLPTSRSHPDTTTTSRRPHLVPGNRRLRCATYLGGPQAARPILYKRRSLATWDTVSQALKNPGRILSGFNGSSTTSLGDIVLSVQAGPVTLNVQFSVVQELSPFNIILGHTWLHYMKVIPSTYHQMVSFLTNEGQIDLYGSQLAARQCYQIAREAGANQEDASPPEPSHTHDQ